MIVKKFLFCIQFIVLCITCFGLYFVSSIWILLDDMSLTVLQDFFSCSFVKWYLFKILYTDWFFTCLDLYVVLFIFLYLWSWYVFCYFTKYVDWVCNIFTSPWCNEYLVCLQLIFNLMSGFSVYFLLALICMFFLFICNIKASKFFAVFTRSDSCVCLWNVHYFTTSSLINFLLA